MSQLQYAVHAYAWTPSWSNQTLDLIDRARRLGFDVIEIPLMELDLVDATAIRERAARAGIGLCTSTACSEANDPTGEDEATRRRAVDYLVGCIKATADMGAKVFTGVTYSAIGRRIQTMPGEEYWERAAKALKKAARYAQDLGITVGIEPINRYESFLVNTCEQGLRLKAMIGEPNVAIHLDAYHMNIEEADFYEPTKSGPTALPLPFERKPPRHSGHRSRRLGGHLSRACGKRLLRTSGNGIVLRGVWRHGCGHLHLAQVGGIQRPVAR
jgi:D-psicose/D-tagatose/L-ribulose 3-epimerase